MRRTLRAALLLLGASSLAVAQGTAGARRDSGGGSVPAVVSRGEIDPRREVNFSALVTPATVYVGQQATYQIGVFLGEDVRQRLRRNPEFVPPDVRSMVTYDLPTPSRPLTRVEAGATYDVHVFQRALFPLTAGVHTIAPARLTYALPLSNSFFSREESHTVRTGAFTVIARDPPEEGRPPGFTGAVGQLTLQTTLDALAARVGDPMTLIVTVAGIGNVSLLPRPEVSLAWGETVAGAERVTLDTTSTLVRGRKDFEWVVTPQRDGSVELPPLRYPYWNPYTERYEIAISRPIPLRVGHGTLATAPPDGVEPESSLPLRVRYRGDVATPLAGAPGLWFALAALPIPALLLGVARRPRTARRDAPRDTLARYAVGGAPSLVALRRAFAAAVGERTGLRAVTLTDARTLVRALRREGVTPGTALDVQRLLAELDQAVYGPGGPVTSAALSSRAYTTWQAVDAEAKPIVSPAFRRVHSAPWLVVAMLVAPVAGGWASDRASDAQVFAGGVEDYERGDLEGAMRAFTELTRRAPRAADAWANLGTVGWQANDTAAAVIGWQRALRLEPLAGDVRGRLEQTPGFRSGVLGDVPPIPLNTATLLGVLLWGAGWGGLALTAWRADRRWRQVSITMVASALLVGVTTVALFEWVEGRDQVVVVAPEPLRAAPALAADVAGEVVVGETGRALGAHGVWRRIRLADGRSGWIDQRRLASLDLAGVP